MQFLRTLYRIHRQLARIVYSAIVRVRCNQAGQPLRVNFYTRVNRLTILGNNFNSNGLRVIGDASLHIGDNFHCGQGCIIITENHNIHGNAIPYDDTYVSKPVKISDNVWLGVNVIVLPGVTIGEGSVIQAGAVVVRDVSPLSICGGNPAVPFSSRDSDHYELMKQLNRFH